VILHVLCRTLYASCGGAHNGGGAELLRQVFEQARGGLAGPLEVQGEILRVSSGQSFISHRVILLAALRISRGLYSAS
jgi:hypothetical protein